MSAAQAVERVADVIPFPQLLDCTAESDDFDSHGCTLPPNHDGDHACDCGAWWA